MIDLETRERIQKELAGITSEHDVDIFYACESGSRLWGFESQDSDYDVRFLYRRPRDWYLSIDWENKRDVIERPISDELDIKGWDLRKALQLFAKSNPGLFEWLRSPCVYWENRTIMALIRSHMQAVYSTEASWYHYLSMAGTNYREFLNRPQVRLKKYFYVLRPILAVRWIQRTPDAGPPPVLFDTLVEEILKPGEIRDEINELLAQKRAGVEMENGPRIDVLNNFIESELAAAHQPASIPKNRAQITNALNSTFRTIIQLA